MAHISVYLASGAHFNRVLSIQLVPAFVYPYFLYCLDFSNHRSVGTKVKHVFRL